MHAQLQVQLKKLPKSVKSILQPGLESLQLLQIMAWKAYKQCKYNN